MAGEDVILAAMALMAVAFVLAAFVFTQRYKRVPPDQAMVVYGARRGDRAWTVVGPGGGRFIRPVVESFKFMSLERSSLRVSVEGVLTKSGPSIHVNLSAVVGIPPEQAAMDRAATALFSKTQAEVQQSARQAVEASTRRVCATREEREITRDLAGLGAAIREEARGQLFEVGLEVFSLTVRDFDPSAGIGQEPGGGLPPPIKALVIGRDA